MEDFRTMTLNNTELKVFRDGRIHSYDTHRKKWVDRKFALSDGGYHRTSFGSTHTPKTHFVHNVIALCYLGEKPEGYQTDHINAIRTDNRVENLQYLTMCQNTRNRLTMNKRLIKGFTITKHGRFMAMIKIDYKAFNLGTYATEEEARQAYADAKLKYHNVQL